MHSGAGAALFGSTTAATNGDSSVSQTFTAPSTGGTLSFWYRVTCPDKVTTHGTWMQVTATLVANHSYTLTLTSHDNDYDGDATYTLFADVTVK